MTNAMTSPTKEIPEGEMRQVSTSVKNAILIHSEAHPFYDQTNNKSVVVISKEVEFVDTDSETYLIPRGVTITLLHGDGGVWNVERHTD